MEALPLRTGAEDRRQRSCSVATGALSGPDRPTIVAAKEVARDRLNRLLNVSRDVFLWVDINGLRVLDGNSGKVLSASPYNEITAWAVDQDDFKTKVYGRRKSGDGKPRMKERTFTTGYGKAMELKLAMEEQVKIYLQQADLARSLQNTAIQLPVGAVPPQAVLDEVEPFGSGVFVAAPGSRRRANTASASFGSSLPSSPMSPAGVTPPTRLSALSKSSPAGASPFSPVDTELTQLGTPPPSDGASGPRACSDETPKNPWSGMSELRGFSCKLVEHTAVGRVENEVLLLVKSDGLHTVKFSAGEKKVMFVAHEDVCRVKRVGDFDVRVQVQSEDLSESMTFVYTMENPHNLIFAIKPYEHRHRERPEPKASMVVPPMFDELAPASSTGSTDEQRLQKRIADLAMAFESALDRISEVGSEEALNAECLGFAKRLEGFVKGKSIEQ